MTKLTPANANPWYVLMTLYGEQDHADPEVNRDRAAKNRRVWNAWSCQGLDDEERARVCDRSNVDILEIRGWSDICHDIMELHRDEMKVRFENAQPRREFVYAGFPNASESIILADLKFTKKIVLAHWIFTQNAFFDRSEFVADIQFYRSFFMCDAIFRNCVFESEARFDTVTFSGDAVFLYAHFVGQAQFGHSTFLEHAVFHETHFEQHAQFMCATFHSLAGFIGAKLESGAHFTGVSFLCDVEFVGATFSSGAWFDETSFHRKANFDSADFQGTVQFVDVHFGVRGSDKTCVPNFTKATFAKMVSFRKADFAQHYPILEGAAFSGKVVVTAKKEFWPAMGQALLDEVSKGAEHIPTKDVAKESCATLRHEIGRQGHPEDEHFFFRREMEFTRQVEWADNEAAWPYFKAWPYWIFKTFSGYGESIARPSLWLLGLWIVPALLLVVHFAWVGVMGESDWSGPDAWGLSFANLFTVFGFHRLYFDVEHIQKLHWTFQLMGAAQTILALPLLFFLGLGLRKRFRLR